MASSSYKKHQSFLIMSVLILFPELIYSQIELEYVRELDTIETTIDIFGETDPMQITLTFDLKKYQREKFKG